MSRLVAPSVCFFDWRWLACGLAIAFCRTGSGGTQAIPLKEADDLFTNGVICRIQIKLGPDACDSLRNNPREFVSGTVSVGKSDHPQVAIRLKGATGSFRPLDDKPAMTLDFGRFHDGQRFHGLRRIYLNNSVEDPSYTNEKLGSELFQAAGVPAPRVTRALVELNGRAIGLYVLKEGFTEDFLARHFQNVSGGLYEPGDGHDVDGNLERNSVEAPFDKDRTALKALAAAALEPDPAQRWAKLQATLDTKRFITFMAMEIMLGHRDGYSIARNNFRVYHDRDGGRMVFIPDGMDQLFGAADLPWQPHLAGLVACAVMDTPEGKQGFAQTFAVLLTNVFKAEPLTNRVGQLVRELRPVLGRADYAAVQAAAESVKDQIVKRRLNLIAQLDQPVLEPLEFTAGIAQPRGWTPADPPQKGGMDQPTVDGLATLHISTRSETLASWRTKVLVPRGRYRFEGRARIAGVDPLPFGTHHGAGLRIGGHARQENAFHRDSLWQNRAAEFDVAGPVEEVELICELRARAGEAWFDLNSLRLIRLDNL